MVYFVSQVWLPLFNLKNITWLAELLEIRLILNINVLFW
jgi:hypothetical protein